MWEAQPTEFQGAETKSGITERLLRAGERNSSAKGTIPSQSLEGTGQTALLLEG